MAKGVHMQVVFSAKNESHRSSGMPALINYDSTVVNEGGAWDGATTFTAPISGVYFFTLGFVKEAFGEPTEDDVFVHLNKGDETLGSAWSGQGTGFRGTGTLSLAIHLDAGDEITTLAASDEGAERFIRRLHFTGFLIPTSDKADPGKGRGKGRGEGKGRAD